MDDTSKIVFIKLWVTGKISAVSEGPPEWHAQAEHALKRALNIHATLDPAALEEELRRQNVPEEIVETFLKNAWLDDDSYTTLNPGY